MAHSIVTPEVGSGARTLTFGNDSVCCPHRPVTTPSALLPLTMVQAGPVQLQQLLQNLLGNAVKFHRAGVRPEVRVRGQVKRSGPAGEQVVFEIEDNGIGFEARFLDRIFTPFQRLHARERYEGSGVGLAICRRVAERHGGSLSARSVPGQGSMFVAVFLRVPPERAPVTTPPSPAAPR